MCSYTRLATAASVVCNSFAGLRRQSTHYFGSHEIRRRTTSSSISQKDYIYVCKARKHATINQSRARCKECKIKRVEPTGSWRRRHKGLLSVSSNLEDYFFIANISSLLTSEQSVNAWCAFYTSFWFDCNGEGREDHLHFHFGQTRRGILPQRETTRLSVDTGTGTWRSNKQIPPM